MKKIFFLLPFLMFALLTQGQQYNAQDVKAYIAKYKNLAIAEQQKTNIPAAIKLGQGILETAAGKSELASQANNHFGIKCKSNWNGDAYYYTDDAKDECFRKYNSAEESYKDHSTFLTSNNRYAVLFDIYPTNYKDWAYQLKNCGYATHPKYAENLIRVIEDYGLQEYTMLALEKNNNEEIIAQVPPDTVKSIKTAEPPFNPSYKQQYNPDPTETEVQYNKATTLHGLKGFYAKKGDVLITQAIQFNIRYGTLLGMNDLKDEPLPYDMFVYLQNKKKKGDRPFVIVGEHETLHAISQREGVQLATLRELNQLSLGEEPAAGETIQLQYNANIKPQTRDPKSILQPESKKKPEAVIVDTPKNNNTETQVTQEEDDEEEEIEDEYVDSDEEPEEEAIVITETKEVTNPDKSVTKPNEKIEQNEKTQKDFRTIETKDGKEHISKTEELKRKMDRSVYSDKDVVPISEEQKRKDLLAKEEANKNKTTNNQPANNELLNRPAKNPTIRQENFGKEPNSLLKEHMTLVRNGQFPKYNPPSNGVAHTQEPPPPAPKKEKPKKNNKKDNKKDNKKVNKKVNKKDNKKDNKKVNKKVNKKDNKKEKSKATSKSKKKK